MTAILRFLKQTRAATAIEYAFIAALVAIASITAMGAIGNATTNTFNNVKNSL